MALLRRKPNTEPIPQITIPVKPKAPEKPLYDWKIASRPYKKRSKEYYTTIASIVFLIAIILLFLKEWLLIVVIISLTFVSYVLASVKPDPIEHKITTWGIVTGGKKYKWENLFKFWFSEKFGSVLLHVDTRTGYPGQIILLVNDKKAEISKILQKYLTMEKPEETFIDNAGKWLQEKVPLESEKASTTPIKKV